MKIDLERFALALAASVEVAEGFDLEEDALFDQIDDELNKHGSMGEDAIDWSSVIDLCFEVLESRAKDLRVIHTLIRAAWVRRDQSFRQTDAIVDGLTMLKGLLDLPVDQQHPLKPKLFSVQLKRIDLLFDRIDESELLSAASVDGSILELIKSISEHPRLADSSISMRFLKVGRELRARLGSEAKARAKAGADGAAPAMAATATDKSISGAAARAQSSATATRTGPDPSSASLLQKPRIDDRDFKRRINELAETIFQLDPTAPASYQLRRFGVWYDLTAAPPIKEGTVTIILPPSIDTVDKFQPLLSSRKGSVDEELLFRLERSLASSPYWFDGHRLASIALTALGADDAAQTVAKACERFIGSLPGLDKLCFADGALFITEQVQAWLEAAAAAAAAAVQSDADEQGAEPNTVRSEIAAPIEVEVMRSPLALADLTQSISEQLPKELDGLQRAAASGENPRVETLCEIAFLEAVKGEGLTAVAARQAARLSAATEAIKARDWDPDLFQRLDGLNDEA